MSDLKTIVLGGGCFWCTEAVFVRVKGVTAVESGYCNGHVPRPTYEQVCGGDTGHNEVIQVTFDVNTVSLETLLTIFFASHDPTTLNRQGNDVGTQYRSGIYVVDESQRAVALQVIKSLTDQGIFSRPIVTEVVNLSNYSKAENYHQQYFEQHPNQGYCAAVIAPKVSKLRHSFAALLKAA
jgi:peptide-methionine (S)-S-oxide reductase